MHQTQSESVLGWLVPPAYLVLDIETTAGDPTEAEAWVRRAWSPSKTWKPATIGERYLEAVAKKEERLALLDSAPIISVAMKTLHSCRVLHWLDCDRTAFGTAALVRLADQRAMLAAAAALLAACDAETILVGHAIRHFDLPKLRNAMLRCCIALPPALAWRDQPTFDTMREWSRFTIDDRQYIPLSELLECCGLADHKQLADGAIVPEMHAAGRYEEILAYATADVLAEEAVYLRMIGAASGGHADIEAAAAAEAAAGPNGTDPAAAADEANELERILKQLETLPC